MKRLTRWLLLVVLPPLAACTPVAATSTPVAGVSPTAAEVQVLRLATTTSTADSGLLDAILPVFEAQHNARVDVIAVGTGQALQLGSNGDVDVVLVHARAREDEFIAAGHGANRQAVMYNDFVIVGPPDDPAGIRGQVRGAGALARIAAAEAPFVSRGDDSGTHSREQSLWAAAGITPTAGAGWYSAIGQGMGETLQFANEQGAYTLTDRGTWLAQSAGLPGLALLVGGESIAENKDSQLLNPYGVIAVNPAAHPGVNLNLANTFVDWLTSLETQRLIEAYGRDQYGQPLFYPDSEAWKASQ